MSTEKNSAVGSRSVARSPSPTSVPSTLRSNVRSAPIVTVMPLPPSGRSRSAPPAPAPARRPRPAGRAGRGSSASHIRSTPSGAVVATCTRSPSRSTDSTPGRSRSERSSRAVRAEIVRSGSSALSPSGVSAATTPPSCSTTTRSATAAASSTMCVVSTMPTPASRRAAMVRQNARRAMTSSPTVGSSSSSRAGSPDQGHRQRDPLLLAARQAAGAPLGQLGDADLGEHRPGGGRRPSRPDGGAAHQLGHGLGPREAHRLLHDAQVPAGRGAARVLPADPDLAVLHREQARSEPDQRRLARAVGPEQRHALAGRDIQLDPGQRLHQPVAVADPRDPQHLVHAGNDALHRAQAAVGRVRTRT